MHKKKETTIFDASVERVVSEVLRWLAEDNPNFTIDVGDGEYVVTEEDLLRDLTIFSEEVFDGETVREPSAVAVKFRNGQTFHIKVEEKF